MVVAIVAVVPTQKQRCFVNGGGIKVGYVAMLRVRVKNPNGKHTRNRDLRHNTALRGPHNAALATRPSQRCPHDLVLLEHYSDEYHGFHGFTVFMVLLGLHRWVLQLLVPRADAATKPGNRENRDPGSPRNGPSQRNPQHVALTTASPQRGPHNATLATRPSQRGPHNPTLTTRASQRGPRNAGLATRPSQRGPRNAALATQPSQPGPS